MKHPHKPCIYLSVVTLIENPYISFRIEIKPDAEYIGGINIFGEKFGDFKQGIIMRIMY